ncbi:galanin receptor type 1 isoform X1 [Lethenteron reissneri]|uniref:galanin receptor type 1 isoform X1 n=1 Tax=Lethenteron reissneri TaxID=7753 RepID=UPI002AB6AE05|nr:galanin receptor type 1 isoform X1 [Lethenteron reissneri]
MENARVNFTNSSADGFGNVTWSLGPGHHHHQEKQQESGDEEGMDLTQIIVPAVFGVIFLLGVLGNTLVLVVLLCRKSRRVQRNTTNTFILNLSVADLTFLMVCVPFQSTIYVLPTWVFGAFLCKAVHYFVTVFMLVSIFTLAAMSVERYIAVVHSHRSPVLRTTRNALAGVAVIWALSVVAAIPCAQNRMLVDGVNYSHPGQFFCWEAEASKRRAYITAIFIFGYLLPLLLISCCYVSVLTHLQRKVRNISKKSQRSKKKTAQTVLVVVAVFCISWLPHHVIHMWVLYGSFPLTSASFAFRIVSHCLSYGNSCANPIIYAFLSENFRKAYRQVFSCQLPVSSSLKAKSTRIRLENFSSTHTCTTSPY